MTCPALSYVIFHIYTIISHFWILETDFDFLLLMNKTKFVEKCWIFFERSDFKISKINCQFCNYYRFLTDRFDGQIWIFWHLLLLFSAFFVETSNTKGNYLRLWCKFNKIIIKTKNFLTNLKSSHSKHPRTFLNQKFWTLLAVTSNRHSISCVKNAKVLAALRVKSLLKSQSLERQPWCRGFFL